MVDKKSDTLRGPAERLMYRRHKFDVAAAVPGEQPEPAVATTEPSEDLALASVIRQVLDSQETRDAVAAATAASQLKPAPATEFDVPTMPLQAAMSRHDPAMRSFARFNVLDEDDVVPAGAPKLRAKKPARTEKTAGPGMASVIWRLTKTVWNILPKRLLCLTAGLVCLAMWYPLVLPAAMVFVAAMMAVVYFTLGPERIAGGIARSWEWLDRRRPAMAERLRRRAEITLTRFEAILHIIPGRWANEIHLPDLTHPRERAAQEARQPDPFEKLGTPAAD
jgi:hypothetical protein